MNGRVAIGLLPPAANRKCSSFPSPVCTFSLPDRISPQPCRSKSGLLVIVPSIRKHGIYATENVVNQILDNPEFGIQLLTALKEEREARVNAEKRVAILSHVRKTYTTTEIAKELGFRSAVAFNRVLCEQHIQYKQNGTYVLYAEYAELGYVHIKQEVLENDKVVYHRRWTQLGREWLIGRFGIKAA